MSVEDARHIGFIKGGYDEMMDGFDPAMLGFPVRVREIDHHDEGTAHEILTDIMTGKADGSLDTSIHYRGKRPGYWMGCFSPEVLLPRYFGMFSPAGVLLGWFSLMFTLGRPDIASLGIVIRAPWRDKGIGTAATRLAVGRKDTLLARPIRALLITTRETNVRMLRIVQKVGLHDLGVIADSGTGLRRRAFATSAFELPRAGALPITASSPPSISDRKA